MSGIVFYYQHHGQCSSYDILANCIAQHGEHRLVSIFNEFLVDVYALSDDPQSRIVAIDFDNTITADPAFYINLIQCYQRQGYDPVICTLRDGLSETVCEVSHQVNGMGVRIYTTDGQQKRDYLKRLGIRVSLWIDDFFPAIVCPGDALLAKNGISY